MWGQEVNKEGKKINLYFCWCWVRTSAWYLVLQVSRGYKMVVLTRAPMAPEVASDKDSRSMPIFKGFIQRKANWVSEKWKGKARRLRMLLKHPWIFELVNSEWLLRLEKKNSYYGTERERVKRERRWRKWCGGIRNWFVSHFHCHAVGCVIGIRKLWRMRLPHLAYLLTLSAYGGNIWVSLEHS